MSKTKIIFFLLVLNFFTGCADGIPILGLEEKGQEQYFFITPSKYSSEMSNLTGEVIDGVSKSMTATSAKAWGVHTIAVGLGVSGEVQAGPVKLAVEPRLRFIFSDKVKPNLP